MSAGVIAAHYVATGSGYPGAVLADSPLVYYRLGDTSIDSSGNGRDGVFSGVGSVAGLLVGDTNKATQFDGSNSKVTTNFGAWMNQASVTYEALVKTTATGVMSIWDRDDTVRVSQFRLNNGALEFIIIGASVVTASSSPTLVNNGTPHHVAATYDGANIRLYTDGAQVKVVATTVALPQNSAALSMGVNFPNNSGGFQHFNGVIDEAAYYGTALSAGRIAAHYQASQGA